ncbi:MAG: hypothetical protein ABI277_13770 [Burkholderiaceae bacterium]
MRNLDTTVRGPGILSGFGPRHTLRSVTGGRHAARFVMQSHVLNAPRANPRALLVAAAIALALYLIGRRIRG